MLNKLRYSIGEHVKKFYQPHVNLAIRRVILDNICQCCRSYQESGVHVLWECGTAQDVWASCPTRLQKFSNGQTDTILLFRNLLEGLPKPELELFLVQA